MVEFDVVVIGGGINGLTSAAYLAKAGASVAVFEMNDEVGIQCHTEEMTIPGLKFNLHATSMFTGFSPCMLDLDLEKYGLELLTPEWVRMQPFLDGKVYMVHNWDANQTYKKWKRLSEKDAEKFRKLVNIFAPARAEFLEALLYTPPSPEAFDRLISIASKILPEGFLEMSGFEVLDLLYEDEHIKTAIAGWENAVGFCPWDRAIGPLGIALMGTGSSHQAVKGGSHGLPHSLFRCIVDHGGKIFQSCTVEKIVVRDGEAKGIILAEDAAYPGREIEAKKAIISDVTAIPTFLQLVGEEHLDPEAARYVRQYSYDGLTLFISHYGTTAPPRWVCADWEPDSLKAWNYNLGAECIKDVEQMGMDLTAGRIPEPVKALGSNFIFTLADPTFAPPGMHNVQVWSDVPYDLRREGGPEKWDDLREEYKDKITDRLEEYAPGFKKSIVVSYAQSPLETYRKNLSAMKGTWGGGPVRIGQFYFDRPFPGCGAPRTPIKKLYLSNSIWPVGFTCLGSGYNAACVVAEDLGIRNQPWWVSKPLVWWRQYLQASGREAKSTVTVN